MFWQRYLSIIFAPSLLISNRHYLFKKNHTFFICCRSSSQRTTKNGPTTTVSMCTLRSQRTPGVMPAAGPWGTPTTTTWISWRSPAWECSPVTWGADCRTAAPCISDPRSATRPGKNNLVSSCAIIAGFSWRNISPNVCQCMSSVDDVGHTLTSIVQKSCFYNVDYSCISYIRNFNKNCKSKTYRPTVFLKLWGLYLYFIHAWWFQYQRLYFQLNLRGSETEVQVTENFN